MPRPTWSTRSVPSGDVALHVREAGPAGAPTVVLVHGYPDASCVWDDVAEHLAGDHHVVTYDVRGMGRSTAPADRHGYRLAHLADDLFTVAAATSPDRPVHVVGHDWGSIQAWEAVTDPERQARIASYTSLSGPCLDHVGHSLRGRLRRPTPRGLAGVARQAVRSAYVSFLCTPGLAHAAWARGADRSFRRFLARVEGVPLDDRQPTLASDGANGSLLYRVNVPRTLARPRHRTTEVPVLLVRLRRDRYVGSVLLDDLPRWAAHLDEQELDAGHWAPRTHPDLVAAIVAGHVATVEAARAA